MEKFILIDGSGLIYRGFYAIPPFLKSPIGVQTNAVFGFTTILLTIIFQQKPDYVAVAFDKKGPTFRHKEFAEYKATRVKAPQELYDQIPLVKEVVGAFKIPPFETEGFEADDIIATIAKELKPKKDVEIFIATGDFDLFQLVSLKTFILYPTKGFKESQTIDLNGVKSKYGIAPQQIPDYKGLVGDNSDNIPGVKGIGPKGAVFLLEKYKSIENIYNHLEEINIRFRKKLQANKSNAFMSKHLSILKDDVPIIFDLDKCHVKNFDMVSVRKIFSDLGFKSLEKRLDESDKRLNMQTTLFS